MTQQLEQLQSFKTVKKREHNNANNDPIIGS